MSRKLILSIACLLLVLAALASAEVRLSAVADKTKIYLGDPIKYILTLEYQPQNKFTPPAPESFKFEPFKVRDYVMVPQPDKEGRKIIQYVFQLTAYELGKFEIPDPQVAYSDKNGKTIYAKAEKIMVEVIKVPAKSGDKPETVRSPKDITKVGFPFWYYLAGLILLIIVAFLVVALLKLFKQKQQAALQRIIPPHELALSKIMELEKANLPSQRLWKDYYSKLSGILREYLEGRFKLNALEQTTWEVIREMRNHHLKTEAINLTGEVLSLADLVKFAKHIPDQARAREDLEYTRQMVRITEPLEITTKGDAE